MTTTLIDLFTSYLDITSPPNVTLLSTLAECATTFNERMVLKYLSKVSQLPFSLFHVTLPTCYDLRLDHFHIRYQPLIMHPSYLRRIDITKYNKIGFL